MNDELEIRVDWERLEEGAPEERACFGMLTIHQGDIVLTDGLDGFVGRTRPGPLVSGYHLAEWVAWNWWRLVTESRFQNPNEDWAFAHSLGTVGAGYLWPNITIFSDRRRTVLVAKPTRPREFSAFRFTADRTVALPTEQFEAALLGFVSQVQGQLRAEKIPTTNFDRIWDELKLERADPGAASHRRLEALLGWDPDDGDSRQIERLLADASDLGQDAVLEVAADHQAGRPIPTAADYASMANTIGTETRPADMVRVTGIDLVGRDRMPAWRCGYGAARALREQHSLGPDPISNKRLADLCAVSASVLGKTESANVAFSLDEQSRALGRIVLRSRYETGRRFELARLLGDRIVSRLEERLIPATRTYTYRQKLQRAFAAELLCPFAALDEELAGDYSSDSREETAHHFNVSELTVATQLVNHGRLDREYLDGDPEFLVA